jgi:hypothetical protein
MATVPQEQVAFSAVSSLLEAFSQIEDPRKARGVRFPVDSILALCVVAFVCGHQNLTQVSRFGRDHRRLLDELGFRQRRSPSKQTLSRVLGMVSVEQFQQAIAAWFRGLVGSVRKRRLCNRASVDGKTTRASSVHVLNVFLHAVEQVVWQAPVDGKQNEISAFKKALDDLFAAYPFLQILTGDAMFAGEPLCGDLIRRGKHYVFQIKADRKHLHEKMHLVFAGKLARAVSPSSLTGEKKRGLRRGA